jgi:hypothetical protein
LAESFARLNTAAVGAVGRLYSNRARIGFRAPLGYGAAMHTLSRGFAEPAIPRSLVVLIVLVAAFPALAQNPSPAAAPTPTSLGGAGGWKAYSYPDKGGKTCYLVGHPDASAPKGMTRGRVDAVVAHRLGDKAYNVVTFDLGYDVKDAARAELVVGTKKFSLFIELDAGWASDSATDKAIVTALAHGKSAKLTAHTARGTTTADSYSLAGFGAALAAIDKGCGVKR